MGSRNLTISDVARRAGVSIATVSRALNGGTVSRGSLQRVEHAVRDLGYQRNTLARSLVTGRTEVVGVLVPDVLGPLYAQMARGIEDVLTPLGMQYTLVTSGRDLDREMATVRFLLEQQVDGLILIGSCLPSTELEALVDARGPVVLIQREAEAAPFTTLRLDNAGGVEQALEHLFDNGHKRVAHIAGVRRDGLERQEAYENAMKRAGLEPIVVASDSTEAGGILAAEQLVTQPNVTAVLCTNDRAALGLYYVLARQGWHVPEMLSVIGFDDLPWASYVTPPLTTLRQPGRAIGSLAARLLLAGSAASAPAPVRPELVIRSSVATVKGGDSAPTA